MPTGLCKFAHVPSFSLRAKKIAAVFLLMGFVGVLLVGDGLVGPESVCRLMADQSRAGENAAGLVGADGHPNQPAEAGSKGASANPAREQPPVNPSARASLPDPTSKSPSPSAEKPLPSASASSSPSDQQEKPPTEKEPASGAESAGKEKPPIAEPKISPAQISQWIEQLGHESYQVREQASAELARAGLAAADALKSALRHPDLEVRRRARWILAQVLEADHRQRLEKFLADPTGSPDHPLPLWKRYRELVGHDEGARKLFAAMQRAEPALLEAVASGGAGGVESVRARLQQIVQRMQVPSPMAYQPSLGTSAAFLFVCSLPELELPVDVAENHYIYNLVHQQGFQQLLHGPDTPEKAAGRRLLGLWILRPLGPQSIQTGLVQNRLQLALQHRLPEGLGLAAELLRSKEKGKLQGYMYAQVVCALGLLGGKTYAEHLVPLLEERQECTRFAINNQQIAVEVRDLALAWLVYLTDQKHADYGMPAAAGEFERLKRIQQYFPNFASFRYSEQTTRDEAIKKLKAWLADHPLPKAPELPKRPEVSKPAKENTGQGPRIPLPLAGPGGGPNRAANPPARNLSETAEGKTTFFLRRADRLLVRSLAQAEDAIHQGRFAEAARILGDILAGDEDYAFQPDIGEPLYRTVKSEAARLLAQMPAEGLETYQNLYEAQAKKELREAAAEGNLGQLQAVIERFFFTRSGAEALVLLSRAFLDRRQPVQAALAARRLATHPQAGQWEPTRSLLEAVGWYLAGDLAAAESALGRVPRSLWGAKVPIGVQAERLFSQPSEAADWLRSHLPMPQWRERPEGWLSVHANPAHNPSTNLAAPYLEPLNHWPSCSEPILAEVLQQIRRGFHQDLRPALVQLYPLVIGDKVIFYTSTRLRAVDLRSGQLAWEAPLEDPLRLFWQPYENRFPPSQPAAPPPIPQAEEKPQSLRLGGILAKAFARQLGISTVSALQQTELDENNLSAEKLREILAEGLADRFWGKTGFGLLSSDGQRIYGLEDTSFRFPVQFQRVMVTADGRRRPEPYLQKNYNLLVAYDLRTGKALWELGGPPDVEGTPLAGAYFLGPPVPVGGRLYAPALIQAQTHLLELDAETGGLLSQLPLSAKQADPQSQRAILQAMGVPSNWLEEGPSGLPAYAEGILVCPTAENHYVAIDLMNRTIRWIYEAAQEEEAIAGPGGVGLLPLALRRAYAAWKQEDDRWLEAAVTIGEGYVLLTLPTTNKLLCLRLADGHRQWTTDRRDGLYVAAVADGKVVVVGRESVWAVRLEDGQLAWASGPVALPPGAMPSGRGYRNGQFYYLPLTTAEVAVFDLAAGRLIARSRSPNGLIPGNLVASNGVILSQDVDGLYRWEILDHRAKQTAARLAERPNNLQALLDHAEVLLAQGQWQNCLDLLQQAKATDGSSAQAQHRFQRLLIAAVQDALLTDSTALLARRQQIENLWPPTDQQIHLLQLLAQAYAQQGQIEPAFDKYLALLQQTDKPTEAQQRLSTVHTVRQDRLLAAQMAKLYQQAPPEVRTKLDAKLSAWKQPDRLEDFLRYFGFHPQAHQLRLELAQRYVQAGRLLEAEWLLQTVFEQASPELQRQAAVRLAHLYRKAGRLEAAADVYRLLAGPWADLVCDEQKTGRQLLESLSAEDPVRRLLTAPTPWPAQPPKVETRSPPAAQRYAFFVSTKQKSLLSPTFTFRFDPNQHQLEICHPSGQKPQPIAIPRPSTQAAFSHNLYTYSQGVVRGHALISWLGSVVVGVDLLSEPGQTLWSQPTTSEQPLHPLFSVLMPRFRQPLRQASPFLADEPLPLAVSSHTVCFQQDRKLVAVEPLSGGQQPLWTRTDMPDQADLFGDDEVLFVTAPGQQEASVLSTLDGRRLGSRPVPDMKNRLLVLGRRVLCWKSEQQSCQAFLVDPWTQQTLWTRQFPPKSQPWVLTDEGRLAVLAPSGAFVLLDLQTGQEVFQASVDPEPNLDSLLVLASSRQYVLIANRPYQPTGPVFFGIAKTESFPVHGRLTALDRRTGQPLWSTEVLEQSLRLGFPRELPVLVFQNVSYQQKKNPRGDIVQQIWETVLCLDIRTGSVLYQTDRAGAGAFGPEIVANPNDRTISIATPRETILLRFGSP